MDLLSISLTILGLALFEIIISIDNAVINAEVLSTMSKKARKWFLLWGIIFAVFVVRGALPWLIIWANNPSLGPVGAFTSSFSNDPEIARVIEESSNVLLVGGGTFLLFIFLHWVFLEPKNYGLVGEEFIQKQGLWFFAVVSVLLASIVWFSVKKDPIMAFGAVVGSTAFFITHGFKENAEEMEKKMITGENNMSDISKILYLEVIDASFSIDGVLGAFAFTFSIPIILVGNGIGAFILRYITVKNIDNVKKYKYLKNGAMYSIFALGVVMVLHSFDFHIPDWVSPVLTVSIIGWFFYKSVRALKSKKLKKESKIKA
ncbi:MAG TPA: DUF475 domain-containing protein [Candidatus Nanoarchaeia archaeon]|nr:DUF475 domain-containing protein [Candidatus Nanoarchaeia archaeon]